MPIVNLFGQWDGDLIFAYPDLVVNIEADKQDVIVGDVVTYNVYYQNEGYEDARDVVIDLALPQEESMISSQIVPTSAGSQLSFQLGNVKAGEGGSFSFTVAIKEPQGQAVPQPPVKSTAIGRATREAGENIGNLLGNIGEAFGGRKR